MSVNPYERQVIVADDAHEILVMTWRDGGLCAPHDHGAAGGRVHVVSGGLVERRYRFDGTDLIVTAEAVVVAPTVIDVDPGVIHDMRARPGTVTVHVYQPRILGMRVYDRERRETLVVDDEHGAWIPAAASDVRARFAWASVSA